MKLLSQNHVKYGLIMCAVVILCLFYMELTGQNESFEKSPLVAFWTFIAPAIVWFFGIRARKIAQKNKLTFKQGATEGFKISVVFAVTSPFIFLLYYLLVNPQILGYVRKAYGLTTADEAVVIVVDLLVQVVSAIIFGTLYGAIISFILKSRKAAAR